MQKVTVALLVLVCAVVLLHVPQDVQGWRMRFRGIRRFARNARRVASNTARKVVRTARNSAATIARRAKEARDRAKKMRHIIQSKYGRMVGRRGPPGRKFKVPGPPGRKFKVPGASRVRVQKIPKVRKPRVSLPRVSLPRFLRRRVNTGGATVGKKSFVRKMMSGVGRVSGMAMGAIEGIGAVTGAISGVVSVIQIGHQIKCGTLMSGGQPTGPVTDKDCPGYIQQPLTKEECLAKGKDQDETYCKGENIPAYCIMKAEAIGKYTKAQIQQVIDSTKGTCCMTCKQAIANNANKPKILTKEECLAKGKDQDEEQCKGETIPAQCVMKAEAQQGFTEAQVQEAIDNTNKLCCMTCKKAFEKQQQQTVEPASGNTCVDKAGYDEWCLTASKYNGCTEDLEDFTQQQVQENCCKTCQDRGNTCVDKAGYDEWCPAASKYNGCTQDLEDYTQQQVLENCCKTCQDRAATQGDVLLNKLVNDIETILRML